MEENKRVLITDLMDGITELLRNMNYSIGTIGVYQAEWRKLLKFNNYEYFSTEIAKEFLREKYAIDLSNPYQKLDRQQRAAVRAINVLQDFRYSHTISSSYRRISRMTWLPIHNSIVNKYIEDEVPEESSESWKNSIILQLGMFSHFIISLGISDFKNLKYCHIVKYIISLKDFSNKTKALRLQQLRPFLRYLFDKGYLENDFSKQMPKLKKTPAKLPQIWTEEQIEKFILSIDRGSPVGKRDYAIFLLMARLGLRVSDVVNMKFTNISWEKNCIKISQQKTGEPLVLPISKELGVAIIDYVKTARPNMDSPYVFLRHFAPYAQLNAHNNFHSEFRKYIRRAGIIYPKDKHIGSHTFRHSLATNMLKNSIDLVTISNIIGHKSMQATQSYLKLDVDHLRDCSIDLEVTYYEK